MPSGLASPALAEPLFANARQFVDRLGNWAHWRESKALRMRNVFHIQSNFKFASASVASTKKPDSRHDGNHKKDHDYDQAAHSLLWAVLKFEKIQKLAEHW
jgi:hypothetical protein